MNQSKLYTVLREPLVHFLLIGFGLFFIYSQMNDRTVENENQIFITQEQLNILADDWFKAKGRVASDKEKEKQLQSFIQEEILYREALSKDLDKNDATIRLHLAKKMKFILDDLSIIPEPTDEQLRVFLSNNSSKFIEDASISFNQVLFTSKDGSQDINKEAKQFLKRLKSSSSSKISTIGDKVELSKKGITNMFGKKFSDLAFTLPLKSWQEPIKTKHGIHLIYIHSRTLVHVPQLSTIKEKVFREWRKKKRDEANEIFYKNLYKNYKIIIENENNK